MGESILKITPEDRVEGGYTSGMVREQAVATKDMWSGFVRTESGSISGWHHHGDYETTIFVLRGTCRLEFGTGGREVVEGREGDFLFVPRNTVHRESNPSDSESHIIVVRAGTGEPVFNVEGPDSE